MSEAHPFTSTGDSELRSVFLPVMNLEQLRAARDLLRQHDEASAKFYARQDALRTWGGPDVDGRHLVNLLVAAQPPAVLAGMMAWREVQAQAGDLGPELQDRLTEQLTLHARLTQFTAQHEQERTALAAGLQVLEQLCPLIDQIRANSAQLVLLLARQTEQRGRGLASLWGAVSGQTAALQREIEYARRTEEQLWTAYRLRATSLDLTQLPKPAELGRLVQARHTLAELMERADAQRQAMETRLRELEIWLSNAQVRLQEDQSRAAATWNEAQRLHHVPDWAIWEVLWRRREEAQVLWQAKVEALHLLQEATRSLKRLWESWPAALQRAEALRQMLPQIERAIFARQAREAEAKCREEEQAQRTALLTALLAALQGRLATVEDERRTEQAQRTALLTALLVALQARSVTLIAEERAREERRQAEQVRTERRRQEEEARRVKAAASAVDARIHPVEVVVPVSPIPPRPHPPTDPVERSLQKAARPGLASSVPYPVLEREHLETARRLLARHAGSAGQAAMCLEALEDWAGPGLDSLRLAVLVSQPLPPALEQALADWKAVQGHVPGDLTGPEQDDYERRALHWETAWTDLRRTLGVPAHPQNWGRLWTGRAKAQTLWNRWKQAQERTAELEAEMAPLWAGWPAPAQNAAALWRAFEAAEVSAKSVIPQSFRAQKSPALSPSQVVSPTLPAPRLPAQDRSTAGPPPVRLPQSPPSQPATVAALVLTPPPGSEATRPSGAVPTRPPAPALRLQPALFVISPAVPVVPPLPTLRPPIPPTTWPGLVPPPVAPLKPAGSLGGTALPPPGPLPVAARPLVVPILPALPLPTALRRVRVLGPALPGQLRSPDPAALEPATLTGRLTRRQRAEREAVRISEQYNWKEGFLLLADALDREKWGQLRVSIEREIECGMTPEEFELVLQMRAYWHEQTHFQSPNTSRYDSLPWGLGLALIRRSAGVPCPDEMILLIDRLYEYADRVCSRRDLPAFAQRLSVILGKADPDVDLEYWLSAQEARCFSR